MKISRCDTGRTVLGDGLLLSVATANVNTLLPREIRDAIALGQAPLESTKVQRLEKEFNDAGLDLVGVQETRVQANMEVNKKHYSVIGSGATTAGTHGVQLWYARHLKATTLDVRPMDHRILFVVMQVSGWTLIIGVVHAPCNEDEQVGPFFTRVAETLRDLESKYPKAFVMLLGHFNARTGSVQAPGIGPYEPQTENSNGESLRLFLLECGLMATNTFFPNGAGYTWTGSHGHRSRIDYVLVKLIDSACVKDCLVDRCIDLVDSERDDHCLFRAELQLSSLDDMDLAGASSTKTVQTRPRPGPMLDASKLRDDACCAEFASFVNTFDVDERVPIDKHLELFQQHLLEGAKVFERRKRRPKTAWISDCTWTLMLQRGSAQKLVRSALARMRTAACRCVFLAWSACVPETFMKHHLFSSQQQAESVYVYATRDWGLSSSRFERARNWASKAIKNDKKSLFDWLASKADVAAEHGDIKKIYKLAKRAAGLKQSELKVVEWEDGSLTTSEDEYFRRFQDHFQEVFGALVVTSLDTAMTVPLLPADVDASPSDERVKDALESLPSNKALGLDGIASEILKSAPQACAAKFGQILRKIWGSCYWPLSWRGGRLHELFKKGSTKNCDHYRGLLIGDHLGKAAADILYDGVDDGYHAYVASSQCGAVKGKGSDFATHLLRTLLDYAASCGKSVAILFVDLVKAFDRVIREVVLGWPQDGRRGSDYLCDLGFNREHADALAAEINKSTVLGNGVDNITQTLLASMHTGTWFKVGSSPEFLRVDKGGRQGCKFGGVIFNLAYAKALKRFVASATAENIPLRLNFIPGAAPGTDVSLAPDEINTTLVFDVTFVDDEAIVVIATVPTSLVKRFSRAIFLLAEAFEWYGMTINWKAGKTEALMVFRGPGAKAQKLKLIQPNGERMFVVDRDHHRRRLYKKSRKLSTVKVHVVSSYKHLGSIIDESSNLVPDARHRERSALSAFVPLVKVLGSHALGLQRKVRLAWSLVMPRLFYNVHVWSSFQGKPRKILNAVYMRVWRRIAGDPRYQRTSWTDSQVRSLLQVPSIDTYLRRRRLVYLSRLAAVDFDALHATLQLRGKLGEILPWAAMITRDLCVLKRAFPIKFESMPSPQDGILPYWSIARDFPYEWKAIVRQLNDVDDDCSQTKEQNVTTTADPQLQAPIEVVGYACGVCGFRFATERQLSTHKWSKHKIRSDIRQYIGDVSVCPVCDTEFYSRARLVKHLLEKRVRSRTRGKSCRYLFLQKDLEIVPAANVQVLDSRDAAVAKVARREGHTSVIAGRPCQRHGPNILKRKAATHNDPQPRKRLRVKAHPNNVSFLP